MIALAVDDLERCTVLAVALDRRTLHPGLGEDRALRRLALAVEHLDAIVKRLLHVGCGLVRLGPHEDRLRAGGGVMGRGVLDDLDRERRAVRIAPGQRGDLQLTRSLGGELDAPFARVRDGSVQNAHALALAATQDIEIRLQDLEIGLSGEAAVAVELQDQGLVRGDAVAIDFGAKTVGQCPLGKHRDGAEQRKQDGEQRVPRPLGRRVVCSSRRGPVESNQVIHPEVASRVGD